MQLSCALLSCFWNTNLCNGTVSRKPINVITKPRWTELPRFTNERDRYLRYKSKQRESLSRFDRRYDFTNGCHRYNKRQHFYFIHRIIIWFSVVSTKDFVRMMTRNCIVTLDLWCLFSLSTSVALNLWQILSLLCITSGSIALDHSLLVAFWEETFWRTNMPVGVVG